MSPDQYHITLVQTSAVSLLKKSNFVLQKKTLKEKSLRNGKTNLSLFSNNASEAVSSTISLPFKVVSTCMPWGERNAVLFQALCSSFANGTKFISTISQFI